MKENILQGINDPRELERLYRSNKSAFTKEFTEVYPEIKDNAVAGFWKERLEYGADELSWGSGKELTLVMTICFFAGLIAKLPDLLGISHDYFYPRNIGFIVLPALITYFLWKHAVPIRKVAGVFALIIAAVIYINVLPADLSSDTLILACIHLPLFLWALLGFTFTGGKYLELDKRVEFLRFNGDLLVMAALIAIAGGIMTAVTFGLFSLIDIRIEDIYMQYVGVWGAASIPLVATFLVRTNPQLVSKVSPVIAKVFTPLVLVMLAVYLAAVIYTGKDPYNDREFLMIFNLLLVGVMAIILFSVAETSKSASNKLERMLLIALAITTIIVNGIALSAILFRISEWGITPNRLAVLGGNILILAHLLMVSFQLFHTISGREKMQKVERAIAVFLPIYAIWTIVVVFLFPLLFGFK